MNTVYTDWLEALPLTEEHINTWELSHSLTLAAHPDSPGLMMIDGAPHAELCTILKAHGEEQVLTARCRLPKPAALAALTANLPVVLSILAGTLSVPDPAHLLSGLDPADLEPARDGPVSRDDLHRHLMALTPIRGAPFTDGDGEVSMSLQHVDTAVRDGDLTATFRLIEWEHRDGTPQVAGIKEQEVHVLSAALCDTPPLRLRCWLLGWREVLSAALSQPASRLMLPMDFSPSRKNPLTLTRPQTLPEFARAFRARTRLGWAWPRT